MKDHTMSWDSLYDQTCRCSFCHMPMVNQTVLLTENSAPLPETRNDNSTCVTGELWRLNKTICLKHPEFLTPKPVRSYHRTFSIMQENTLSYHKGLSIMMSQKGRNDKIKEKTFLLCYRNQTHKLRSRFLPFSLPSFSSSFEEGMKGYVWREGW